MFCAVRPGPLAALLAALAALAAAGAAVAREPYDRGFFVRQDASAVAMLDDRADCARLAAGLGVDGEEAAYSDPQYGPLRALGQALDEDQLHGEGLKGRMQRAAFGDCMRRRGWTPLAPSPDEAKALKKASLKHPAALDAWLKAHDPGPAPAKP
jgi:hypothetical protein